ncbi:hypothetical protein GWK47_032798 [Chionoecetes opilio]|uniref:Uncharacterized protein n=1 Tax=Chionoecetes opilio TaxID=41210 RepID=A0A8J4YYR8_CHIOP|nr:hypothetical protein GWK47_032798 [Chionoecetes opilio]
MEKILNRWIFRASGPAEEKRGRRSHQEKARSIYDHLAEKEPSGPSPPPRVYSQPGVVPRFKQRFSLHNIARTELILLHGAEPSVEEIIQMNEDDQAVMMLMKMRHRDRLCFHHELRNLLREADNLTELFTDQDPHTERGIKFKRVVDEGLIPYKETLRTWSLCLPKAHHSFLQTISASTPPEAFYTCYKPPVTTPPGSPLLLLHQI